MEIEMTAEKDRPSEVVKWDRFLPSTVLTVLLVEPDDSTRHIICVLLRKCSYRVIAVPDGLMAWETLKEQPHNIDLVLTEVELPTVSGFALLTLVMKHDICKNIPVIMMSLHDSISMVLKCMLKGAADFLIKPVRKNELRNLWQHVWRRKSLLGGSVPPDLSDVHRKDEAISENNTASNNSSDHVASTQKNEGSKKVSDAQGLSQSNCRGTSNLCDADMEKHDDCVKLETESLIHESKTEEGAGNELVVSEKLYRSRSEVAYRDDALRLKVGCDYFKGVPQGEAEGPEINNISNGVDGCNDELIGPTSGAIDLIGTFDNHHKSSAAISTINDDKNKFEFSPQLELSLRDSFCAASNDEHEDEGNTLNHSTASAFSWYNNNKAFLPSASTFSELKDGASKSSERLSNQLSANATPSSQPSGATSITCWEKRTSLVVDQAEVAFPRPLLGFIPIPGVKFETIPAGYSHVFPDVQHYRQSHLTPAWCPKSSCQQDYHPISLSASAHTSPDVHDLEQGYIQTGENNNYSVGHTLCEENRVESLEELRRGTAGSEISDSSLCNDLANNSNGGTCGGVCSRDDRNDSSGKVIENVIAPHNLNEGALFVHDGSNGISSLRSSQREAALTKFRLKRKNRCFEKKVRYQTRKTLAEQRPRVKGQFVPRVKNDTRVATADN